MRVIDLGEQYIQGLFSKPGAPDPPLDKVPMTLGFCMGCNLLQMENTVPPSALYSDYWYQSGTNQTMRDHLAGIAKEAQEISGKQHAKVLDIGCNDGTLLNSYPDTFSKFGIDPSNVSGDDSFHRIKDTFPSKHLDGPFDIVTSIAMFYDVEDPVSFCRAVKDILAPDGIWVIEVAYLLSTIRNNSYDTICAEHLLYYSLNSLRSVLMWANLWTFRASLNQSNGGSVRVYATHSDRFNHELPPATDYSVSDDEATMELSDPQTYLDFQIRIKKHRLMLISLLVRLKESGKTIHGYGASTKGNTLLQYCAIDGTILDVIADRNPRKHGAFTLSGIPIVSEAESRAMKPDYYLVLPWHFKSEILAREKDIMNQGTKMIFPLPTIEIYP